MIRPSQGPSKYKAGLGPYTTPAKPHVPKRIRTCGPGPAPPRPPPRPKPVLVWLSFFKHKLPIAPAGPFHQMAPAGSNVPRPLRFRRQATEASLVPKTYPVYPLLSSSNCESPPQGLAIKWSRLVLFYYFTLSLSVEIIGRLGPYRGVGPL